MAEHPTGGTSRPLGPGKILLFTLVAAGIVLAVLEGVSAWAEPRYFPYQRSFPIAAPGAPGGRAFAEEASQARMAMAPDDRPSFKHMEMPLVADDTRRWALPPNTELEVAGVGVRVNDLGMRGSDVEITEGDVRLFTLGDSSIFGDGMEESQVFSTIAAALLSKGWSREVKGIIGAVPGHDTGQSLQTLKGYGERIRPTWVVVGNIWSDVFKDQAGDRAEAFTYLPPVQGVLRRSAFYRLLWRGISPMLNAQQVRWITSRDDVGRDATKDTRVPLARYVANLRAIAAESARIGARVAFLGLPAPMDFDQLPVPDTVTQYRLAMAQVAKEVGAPWVDGPRIFAERGATIGYFDDQVHPGIDGHLLLGVALAEALMPEGPPPDGLSLYPAAEVAPRPEKE